jgi:hypothetical protein
VQIDFVVSQHETDALVRTELLAEGLAGAGVLGRDVVGAPGGTEPAHAMGQARWR